MVVEAGARELMENGVTDEMLAKTSDLVQIDEGEDNLTGHRNGH